MPLSLGGVAPLSLGGEALFAGISIVLSIASYVPYYRGLWRGTVQPHLFTWIIWSLTSGIIFLAATAAGGGAGLWFLLVGLVCQLGVVLVALRQYQQQRIRRLDWVMLGLCFLSVPIWQLTKDPLAAVLLLSFINILGFGPTLLKSWHHPHAEDIGRPLISSFKHAAALLALAQFNLTTACYSAHCIVMNLLLVGLILLRRRDAVKI